MKKNILIALPLLLMGIATLIADIHDNAGQYGYQFLDIGNNPVSLALAGRGISSSSNLASFLRQPASALTDSHRSLGANHMMWLEDTAYNAIHYSYSDRKKHFGLALRGLDYGELEIRDDNGVLIGYYSPLDIDLMANYALRVTPSLYAGLNAGIAYEKLDTDSSLGIHSDLGATWLPPIADTQMNLAVRNLGISSAMNEERTLFAPSLEIDISKRIDFTQTSLNLELGGTKAIDEHWKATVSAELTLFDMVMLRAGYKLNYDAEDLTAGLGLRWKRLGIDYGWASYSNHLNDVHSFGLSYFF
jgi:hypothetical protein